MGLPLRSWTVRVEARLPDGGLKASWEGVPLLRQGAARVFVARWRRPPLRVGPLVFKPGDRLVEWVSSESWFNAFRVHDARGRLRGWYVNLVRPRRPLGTPEDERWTYTDLGLDFAVTPQGCAVLDEDALEPALRRLPAAEAARARLEAERLRSLLARSPDAATAFLDGLLTAGAEPGELHLAELAGRWGPPRVAVFATIHLGDAEPGGARGWYRMYRDGRRVAEALAVVLRRDRVLLHRKAGYPEGTVRLPGGGVAAGEAPDAAALRELLEETRLEGRIRHWLGYVRWEIRLPDGARFAMPNYLFEIADESGREPVPAAEERIVELPWRPVRELPRVAAGLRGLSGRWAAWGIYRALPHDAAYAALAGGSS